MPAEFLALIASALFGLSTVVTRRGLEHASVASGVVYTMLPSAAVLIVPGLLLSPWPAVGPLPIILMALSGLVGSMLGRILLTTAVARLGAATAGPLQGTYPFWAFALAALVLGEQVTGLHLLGGGLVVGGVTVLMAWGRAQPARLVKNPHARRDMLYPLAAAMAYAFGDSLARMALREAPYPIFGAGISYLASTSLLLGAFVALPQLRTSLRLGGGSLGWFLAGGVLMGLAVVALFSAFNVGQVIQVSPIIGAQPLFVLLWSAILLRQSEFLRPSTILGAALIVAGVALVSIAGAFGGS